MTMWNTTHSTAPTWNCENFNAKAMLARASEVIYRNIGRELPPTSLVMTHETWEAIKESAIKDLPRGILDGPIERFFGFSVETFATHNECISRVVTGKMNGENPQLITTASDFRAAMNEA